FYNFSMPVILALVAFFYRHVLNSESIKKIIPIALLIFTMIHILNILFGEGWKIFNTFTLLPAQAAIGFLAFLYLRQTVEHEDGNPFQNFIFWFSIANL